MKIILLALLAALSLPIYAQTVTVTGSVAPGTYTLTPVTANPTPPATGTYWVYYGGKFNWTSDFSFLASINYLDTAGAPLSGSADIAVSILGSWGGWQPYLSTGFDVTPYKSIVFCTKPTVDGELHGMGFAAIGDVGDGIAIPVVAGPGMTKYGPVPQKGVWGCYKVPLADFKLTNPKVLKFSLTDGTGLATNKFYVDNVGFSP